MTHNPREKNGGRSMVIAVGLLAVVLLVVAYALNIGPASMLVVNGKLPVSTYFTVYGPVEWLAPEPTARGRLLGRYRGLFVDEREWQFIPLVYLIETTIEPGGMLFEE